jgi:hypothetical protein
MHGGVFSFGRPAVAPAKHIQQQTARLSLQEEGMKWTAGNAI